MEYALITAFLILVIVLSILAFIFHDYVRKDIKGKKLQTENEKLIRENKDLKQSIDWLQKNSEKPTLRQALDNVKTSDVGELWTKLYPSQGGFGTVPSATYINVPFTSTQYDER